MTGGEDLRLVMRHSPTSTSRDWSASLRMTRSPSSSKTPPGGVPSAPLVDRAMPGARCSTWTARRTPRRRTVSRTSTSTTSMTRDSVAFPAARRRAGRRPHGKGLLVESDTNPVLAVCDWLATSNNKTPRLLRKKAVEGPISSPVQGQGHLGPIRRGLSLTRRKAAHGRASSLNRMVSS
jgi:hypothetical protein